MPELNVQLPDDLDARLRSHLAAQGEDVAQFVTRAVQEQLACESDAAHQAQVSASIQRSAAEFDAGQGLDARQAMRQIADEFGIKLRR